MLIRFSPKTGNFYPYDINYTGNLPGDVMNVSTDDYSAAMNRPPGSTFAFVDGALIITPAPAPNASELSAQARSKRDAMIAETDYLVMPDYPLSAPKLEAVNAYRHALRDVPAQAGFPQTVNWPTKP